MAFYEYQSSQMTEKDSLSSSPTMQNRGRNLHGNSTTKELMHTINDVQDWMDLQVRMVSSAGPSTQTERVNGVLHTVNMVNRAFKAGEDFNMSQLPQAPSAKDKPDVSGLLPQFKSLVDGFNLSLSTLNSQQSLVASLGGGFQNGDVPVDRALLVASAAQAGMPTSLQTLATQIGGLKLKLPGEGGNFSIAAYGDFNSLVLIMNECLQMGMRSPDQVAYILSTAWLESKMGEWMTESGWLSRKSAERHGEREYGPNGRRASEARSYGHTQSGDGAKYMGRGFVQLTWKDNYARMSKLLINSGYQYTYEGVTYGNGQNGTKPIDLVKNYNHVSDNKELAARILVFGMDGGHYAQNGGLDDYIPENQKATHGNFQNARKIVNGHDKKRLIADNAVTIQNVLRNGDAWVNLFSE